MRKLLLLASVAILGWSNVHAQCTPDPQYTDPGIYPDSATGFASACVGQLYEQLITNVVPVDTCVVILSGFPCQTVSFDSIVITDFQGLPASLSYACSSTLNGCSFAGGTTGCAIIQGTPTVGDIGTHNLVITVDVYVGGLATPSATEVIDWYYIDIEDCTTTGLGENSTTSVSLYPNPADQVVNLQGVSGDVVTITNVHGQIMQVIDTHGATEMEINVMSLSGGIYFVQMGHETIRFVKK